MTNTIKCITLRFVKRINPFDIGCANNQSGAQGFRLPPTFSLLWTLDPTPFLQFRMPVSFSPFLPFWAFEKTAGNGDFFYPVFKPPSKGGYSPPVGPRKTLGFVGEPRRVFPSLGGGGTACGGEGIPFGSPPAPLRGSLPLWGRIHCHT